MLPAFHSWESKAEDPCWDKQNCLLRLPAPGQPFLQPTEIHTYTGFSSLNPRGNVRCGTSQATTGLCFPNTSVLTGSRHRDCHCRVTKKPPEPQTSYSYKHWRLPVSQTYLLFQNFTYRRQRNHFSASKNLQPQRLPNSTAANTHQDSGDVEHRP